MFIEISYSYILFLKLFC